MPYLVGRALCSTDSAKARFDGGLSGPLAPLIARRLGIENRHRRDAGNEYNHSLNRTVKLRRRQRRVCTAIHVGLRTNSGREDKQCNQHEVERA